jgi:hypothetical protein
MRDRNGIAERKTESPEAQGHAYRYHLLRTALGAGLSGLDRWDQAQAPWIAEKASKSFDSECPSAMGGGCLGTVPRGHLYEALDEALFALPEGGVGVSKPVESGLGFHLTLVRKDSPGTAAVLRKARQRIRRLLETRAGRSCQKAWSAELQRGR